MSTLSYSFIIPVFNRPNEIDELLASFLNQNYEDSFEVVIVEDGSTLSSEQIISKYQNKLNLSYYKKQNTGPGDSRNYGMQRATGTYFIILDSDCIVPPHYLKAVDDSLTQNFYHCFGGADAAHHTFTNLQKAISYVMTSFLTTGGIRGSSAVKDFEPRSFNMGISKEAYIKTGGFATIHPGEDPDLSLRIKKCGFKTTFLPDAYVYHKRRISWKKFYNQVRKFGLVRPILNTWHPESSKITFWFPLVFVFFSILSVVFAIFFNGYYSIPILFYLGILFIDSSIKNKNILVGLLTIPAVFVQFFGYGLAFLKSTFYIRWLKRDPGKVFPYLFFE